MVLLGRGLTVSIAVRFNAKPHPGPLDHNAIEARLNGCPELAVCHPLRVLLPFAGQCGPLRFV
jgi:hypothetical protein